MTIYTFEISNILMSIFRCVESPLEDQGSGGAARAPSKILGQDEPARTVSGQVRILV